MSVPVRGVAGAVPTNFALGKAKGNFGIWNWKPDKKSIWQHLAGQKIPVVETYSIKHHMSIN
jgi:hypothetical protein